MVDPIYQLEDTSELFNETEYQTVKNIVTNKTYFAERIAEVGIINFGGISANKRKKLNLGDKGITSPIMITSVYVFSPQTTNDEIRVLIYQRDDRGREFTVAQQRFSNSEMPKSFPYGGVLFPSNSIEVIPRQSVLNCVFYFRPVRITAQISAD